MLKHNTHLFVKNMFETKKYSICSDQLYSLNKNVWNKFRVSIAARAIPLLTIWECEVAFFVRVHTIKQNIFFHLKEFELTWKNLHVQTRERLHESVSSCFSHYCKVLKLRTCSLFSVFLLKWFYIQFFTHVLLSDISLYIFNCAFIF